MKAEKSATESNRTDPCDYPTIFFYNLKEQQVEWEIMGGIVFVQLENDQVMYLKYNND